MFKTKKTLSEKIISTLIVISFICLPINSYAQIDPNTLPEGWTVVDGTVYFDGSVMGTLDITQTTDFASIDWDSFSIGADGTVNFYNGANGVTLNTVTGGSVSEIWGTLWAEGQIFLINNNGILFAPGSQVNAAGLVASTLDFDGFDRTNLANFSCPAGGCGAVINQGAIHINQPGGYAALLGSRVENSGVIVANVGTVALASGRAMTLGLDAGNLISVVVDEAVANNIDGADSAVENTGTIVADGGTVLLTSDTLDGVFDNAINNEGIIEAQGIADHNGEVVLTATGENSVVKNTGTIDVRAKEEGAGGGFVELSGSTVDFNSGTVNLGGGEILIDPTFYTITDGDETAWQGMGGSVTLDVLYDIYFHLGDKSLDLSNFLSGETFTLHAGRDILMYNNQIVTQGGNVALFADYAADYGDGFVPSDGVGSILIGYPGNQYDGEGGIYTNGGNITLSGVDIKIAEVINAGMGDVSISATGEIIDYDDNHAFDIIASDLDLTAGEGIGNGNALETQVNRIEARITDENATGNIEIDNTGDLDIRDFNNWGYAVLNAGLGSVNVDVHSNLNIIDSIYANGDVNLTASEDITHKSNGDVFITNGDFSGYAGQDYIMEDGSSITAIKDSGDVSVSITAENSGDIRVNNSSILAKIEGDGTADVSLTSGGSGGNIGDISINDSTILAKVEGDGHAEVHATAENNFLVDDSLVRAETGSSPETAIVSLAGLGNMNIINSAIQAQVFGTGVAAAILGAGGNLYIDEDSELSATTNDGISGVLALAGGTIDNQGVISALSTYGYAGAGLLAVGDIHTGQVTAQGGESADVIPFIESLASIDIGAQFGYSSGILITSLDGDVTLGDILADAVLVAAFGADGDGSIIYDEGDVAAHYLGLLARNYIGTSDAAIQTDVDILSAYSWDEGDIFINEANDIELGLYLPVFEQEGDLIGALGASVAANNGLIHIQSQGDMVVNSVIAPNGGVYLGSANGSIYAGHGWDPAIDRELVEDIADMFSIDPDAIAEVLMDLSGTPLSGVGVDYFTPVQLIGSEGSSHDYNVIAGGYSYFTTPNGTIGVGTQEDTTEYNPLNVYIEAGENNSVLPLVPPVVLPPTSITTPGLILQIGGVIPEAQLDPNNPYPGTTYNGPIGLSGAIAGYVSPGDVAITNVFPSPGVEISDGGPSGYVFFDNQNDDLASLQIWPAIPDSDVLTPYLLEDKYIRVYYELTENYRIASFEPATPTDYYAYHPISGADSSAFDSINIDPDAYEFINDNIDLKQDLNSYFSEDEQKKDKTL